MIGAISRNMRAVRANVKLADVIAYAAIALLFLVLAYQLSARIQFPWDKMVWVESPFLTDMVKLSAGEPVFGTIEDGNSFVYSPGLTYLSYALLKPFGLQLDIRFGDAFSSRDDYIEFFRINVGWSIDAPQIENRTVRQALLRLCELARPDFNG